MMACILYFYSLMKNSFVHKIWGDRCGFAWIEGDLKSKAQAVNYVCKYCVKGGQIEAFVAPKEIKPKVVPFWWLDGQNSIVKGCPGQLAQPLTMTA